MKRFAVPQAYVLLIFLLCCTSITRAENGYDLWLRYIRLNNTSLLATYKKQVSPLRFSGESPTLLLAKKELLYGLESMTGTKVKAGSSIITGTGLVIARWKDLGSLQTEVSQEELTKAGQEGFILITTKTRQLLLTANTDIGILYGVFHLLRLVQTEQPLYPLHIVSAPKLRLRLLNHWDNLNRTVERGYAGFSIWDWHKLPGYIDQRYIDYARANASIGINGAVLNNVNANAIILTAPYLQKVKVLADIFRPYGIKVYLSAKFSAPIEIGKLKTADPLDPEVRQWWKEKAKEIYSLIPDFGGFLVKANSEGQPGPQDYHRSHAEGANMLAEAVGPYKGIIVWRAFVYAAENPVDRHKQAYDEFVPLDGKFLPNVMVQVKNGAIDFMPREPFHPLFGAMPKTPLMAEFQITQEYTGQSTNLVYLAPLFKEVLNSDTYSKGKGSYVATIIDGSQDQHSLNGMAGVSNIGNDINWCGHPFAQSNWYAYGRLCWDYELTSMAIADEWLRMTFSNDTRFVEPAKKIMLESRETMVNYSNPLGLHHIMGANGHYGPGPWVDFIKRPEWNAVYYHKADSLGIGFNRTATGSYALAQYFPEARKQWEDVNTIDEKYLLWFHHVPWVHTMKSGRTLWNELCFRYYDGAEQVNKMKQNWNSLKPFVDQERFSQVSQLLAIQQEEAIWWRNSCLLYFQTFSRMPIPATYEQPDKTLEYYKSLRFPFTPGN